MVTYDIIIFPVKWDWGKCHKEGYKTLSGAKRTAEKLAKNNEMVIIYKNDIEYGIEVSTHAVIYENGKIRSRA